MRYQCNCCDVSECCDKYPDALDEIARLKTELWDMGIAYMKARTEIMDARRQEST